MGHHYKDFTLLFTRSLQQALEGRQCWASMAHGYETELRTGDVAHLVAGLACPKLWVGSSVAGYDRVCYSPRTRQIEEGQPVVQGHPVLEHSTFCMAGEEPGFRLWGIFKLNTF